jgi:hypothetical protein
VWFAATCCYQTLQNALDLALSKGKVDLRGRLLSVDEGHHAGKDATKLHQLIKQWVELGGRVLLVTATPYRTDGKAVFQAEQPRHVRTIAEHALDTDHEGRSLVPSRMWMCAERLAGYKATSGKELNGTACPAGIGGRASLSLTRRWEKDGKPKTVIVVPQQKSRDWALRLQKAFEKRGARVLNAVGVGAETQQRLREVLETEGSVSEFGKSQVDVILACKRFDEGTDWPLCSHIYVVGFPRSLPLTVQRWGRTFRPKHKITGHTHPEDACIVFFCPDPTGLNGSAMQAHKQAALLTACHLHDFETAQQYTRRLGIGRVVGDAIRSRYDLKFVQRVVGALKATEAERAVAKKAIQEIVGSEEGLSVPQVARRLGERGLKRTEYLAGLSQLLEDVSEGDLTKKEARALRYALNKALGKTRNTKGGTVRLISKDLIEAFNEVLDNYDDIKVKADQGILSMTGLFTGESAKEIGEQLRQRMVVTPESAKRIVMNHYRVHQRRPTRRTSLKFNRLEATLSRNFGITLTKLCDEMGLPPLRKQRSHAGAKKAIQAHFDEHGVRPDQSKPGEWASWDGYLRYHHNSSLWELCDEMGLPRVTAKRTLPGVRAEVQAHFDEHGVRPSSREKKWALVSSYLRRNHGITLRQLCDEMGLPRVYRPPTKHTKDDPVKFAQTHFDEHGVRPSRDSPGGGKWDYWCQRHLKMSLSKLCDELGLPPLRKFPLLEIRKGVQAHFDEHGIRPSEGTSKKFNNWSCSLRRNYGTTLSQLCDEMGLPILCEKYAIETIRKEVRTHVDEHGAPPRRATSKKFNNIGAHLLRQHGMTLSQLCDEMGLPSHRKKTTCKPKQTSPTTTPST